MRYFLIRGFWFGMYIVLILAPLFSLLTGGLPGQGFWCEFSAALGFSALAMMGLQFALTARFKKATAPFGIDIIYHFHCYMGLVLLAFIIIHPVIFFLKFPGLLVLLNPLKAPLAFRSGLISELAAILLVWVSLVRRRTNLEYDYWRLTHVLLSLLAVGFGLVHIFLIGHYTRPLPGKLLWAALALIWVLLALFMRVLRPYLISKRPYILEELRPERGDSWTIRLLPEGHQGFRFQAGQFAWISIWHSPFTLKEHPFSIASSADAIPALEFTIKERGDFTKKIKTLSPGARVYVDAPYGSFCMDRYCDPTLKKLPGLVFVAGGIGIAPIMSMLRTLKDRKDPRTLVLFYSNKKYQRAAFLEEINSMSANLDLKTIHIIENPDPDWQGEKGFITKAILDKYLPPERKDLEYFICGPDPMMDSVERALHSLGIPVRRFHSEIFTLV
jgi:predicted ferric reductase